MIARPQRSSSRLFPLLSVDIYIKLPESETGTDDQRAAADLLLLAKLNLTKAQQFFAHKLSPKEHLSRLLIQHRLGLEAELSAQWQRADFYWQQVQNQLKALSKRKDLWQALAAEIAQKYPNAQVLSDPINLQQRLVEELFIDTHCQFHNSLTQLSQPLAAETKKSKAPWNDRAFVHIRYIEQLLPYSSLSPEHVQDFLSDSWQQQINLCRHAKDWTEAIKLCRHRLSYCSSFVPFQSELAEIQANAVLSKLTNGESEKQRLKDIKQLQRGVRQFEDLAKAYPHSPVMFDYLGNLHHLHAMQLGNSGFVAEGLVAVEKALIYTPRLQGALSTRNSLTQAMEQLNEYVRQLKAQLAQHPNAKLNAQGQKVITQAKKGFGLRDKYLRSDQAKNASKAILLAQAMEVWRNIEGLPDAPAEKQAIALLSGLSKIFEQPPANRSALSIAWQVVVQENPELAELNAESIQIFLEKRLWKTERSSPIITPPPQSRDSLTSEELAALRPVSFTAQPGGEPFLAWVFSRQNLGLKVQAAITAVALLAVGSLGLYEMSVRSTRQTAYEQIVNADLQQNPGEVIAAAEKFLSRRSLSYKDAREAQVKELYTQAFISWFLQQSEVSDEETIQAQFDRYQTLTKRE